MTLVSETVRAAPWYRIADPAWRDPVDPGFAQVKGGRWNPPGSWPTLYLNGDIVTARLNLQLFVEAWPYEPEDLRPDAGPVLVDVQLPRGQRVADLHSPDGIAASTLPSTYPLWLNGRAVGHQSTQPVGAAAKADGLRGVLCRSATSPLGEGRELAWFPATARSRATVRSVSQFSSWYWS